MFVPEYFPNKKSWLVRFIDAISRIITGDRNGNALYGAASSSLREYPATFIISPRCDQCFDGCSYKEYYKNIVSIDSFDDSMPPKIVIAGKHIDLPRIVKINMRLDTEIEPGTTCVMCQSCAKLAQAILDLESAVERGGLKRHTFTDRYQLYASPTYTTYPALVASVEGRLFLVLRKIGDSDKYYLGQQVLLGQIGYSRAGWKNEMPSLDNLITLDSVRDGISFSEFNLMNAEGFSSRN